MFRNEGKRARRRAWPISGYVGPNGGGKTACMVWDTIPSLLMGRPVLSTVRILDFRDPRPCDGCDEPGHFRPVYGPVKVEDLAHAELADDVREALYREASSDPTHEEHAPPFLERVTHDDNGFPIRDIVDWVVHGAAHPLYVPFTEWEQLLEARACDVLMDEVTGVASSRESMGLPAPVANKLVQLRRSDVVVRFSAPAWARSDKIIRETAQSVTFCRGYLAKSAGDGDRLWRQRRLFRWQTFDAQLFDEFTHGKREGLAPMVNDWHWGPGSPSFDTYDTYDSVSVVGTVTDSGRCYRCGGKRDIPRCRCDKHEPSAKSSGTEGGRPEAARGPAAEPIRGGRSDGAGGFIPLSPERVSVSAAHDC